MAKDVVIRDVVYEDVPSVTIPLSGTSGNATFTDTSDATLNSGSQMLDGVTGYNANGTKITGSIPSKSSSDLTVSGATVTVPAGNYASQATKSVASGSATVSGSKSSSGATLSTPTASTIALKKTISITPTVTEGYVSTGTAGNVEVTLTAAAPNQGATTYTPGTSDQTIAAGTYLTGAQTIQGDADLIAANIVYGKNIFGVAGSAKIPVISQDSTTKVLSIS